MTYTRFIIKSIEATNFYIWPYLRIGTNDISFSHLYCSKYSSRMMFKIRENNIFFLIKINYIASQFDIIHYWGYPFSISEQFQLRNTNQNIKQSYSILSEIKKLADDSEKEIVAYLSMGFGNPYNEKWSIEIALEWCKRIADIGINIISLSDTIGLAKPADIEKLFKVCKKELPNIEFGAHLHTREDNYLENISTAYEAGCRRFDSAINGLGGCPFATDKLTGNLPTEKLLKFLEFFNIENSIDKIQFKHAMKLAQKIFI